jgi:hypothetical protein
MTITPYMLQRQQMKNGSKKTDQQQRAEDRETKGKQAKISRESKKRKELNKEYKKVSKPMWEGQECALKVKGVCSGMAQGWNHAAGKENAEKLLDMENGQPACNSCNGWCEDNHAKAVEMGFRNQRNTPTKRYKDTYKKK